MRLEVFDDTGVSISAILKLDGSPAVEGVDFVTWDGKFHKNGRHSYQEGGIISENIAIAMYVPTRREIYFKVVKNDTEVASCLCKPVSQMTEYPIFEGEYSAVFIALFEAHLAKVPDQNAVAAIRNQWQQAKGKSLLPINTEADDYAAVILKLDGSPAVEGVDFVTITKGVRGIMVSPNIATCVFIRKSRQTEYYIGTKKVLTLKNIAQMEVPPKFEGEFGEICQLLYKKFIEL